MPFFQNVFNHDFHGVWSLGDRHHSPEFKISRNHGRGEDVFIAHTEGSYDLSGNDADSNSRDTLTIWWSLHNFIHWSSVSVDITATASSDTAVTPADIVTDLNADATFSSFFTASTNKFDSSNSASPTDRVVIRQDNPATMMRSYIQNGRAEEAIGFNAKAGIAELPNYFARHKIHHLLATAEAVGTAANQYTDKFVDNQNMLIQLVPGSNTVELNLINNAVDQHNKSLGLVGATVRSDYQLLEGKSGLFIFKKVTVDGSDRITQIIEYSAGAVAGDLAKKITYSYTSSNKNYDKQIEIPYVLASADLVTP